MILQGISIPFASSSLCHYRFITIKDWVVKSEIFPNHFPQALQNVDFLVFILPISCFIFVFIFVLNTLKN